MLFPIKVGEQKWKSKGKIEYAMASSVDDTSLSLSSLSQLAQAQTSLECSNLLVHPVTQDVANVRARPCMCACAARARALSLSLSIAYVCPVTRTNQVHSHVKCTVNRSQPLFPRTLPPLFLSTHFFIAPSNRSFSHTLTHTHFVLAFLFLFSQRKELEIALEGDSKKHQRLTR